MTGDNITADV